MTEKTEVEKLAKAIREASEYDRRPTDKFFGFVNLVIKILIWFFIFQVVFGSIFWIVMYWANQ